MLIKLHLEDHQTNKIGNNHEWASIDLPEMKAQACQTALEFQRKR